MKTTTITMAGFVASLLVVAGCGGVEVGLNEETLGAVECISNPSKCKDDPETTDTGSDESDDSDAYATDDSEHDSGSAIGSHDTSGGVQEFDGYDRDSSALFLGTWTRIASDYDYAWSGQNRKCEYSFPAIIRGYSHDNVIDFENSGGDLQWIAQIYPDETFDFGAHFQDRLGRETVTVDCTCLIVEPYYNYYPEEINCTCEGSDVEPQCLLYYEKMATE